MNYLLFVLIGLAAGWIGGHLVALSDTGSNQDLLAGVVGAAVAGIGAQSMAATGVLDRLAIAVSAAAGALLLTLMRRAYVDRYVRVSP